MLYITFLGFTSVIFFFNKIWVLLVNYSHNVILIDFPSLFIPLTQSRTVCQSNFPHVGQEPWMVPKIPFLSFTSEKDKLNLLSQI